MIEATYHELKELFGMENPTRPWHMFKEDVALELEKRWGGAAWQLVEKMSDLIQGSWENCRTPAAAADLAEEIYMSKSQRIGDEDSPTKLAKKWGNYNER